MNPLIEEKYDEAYEICEKGSRLLGRNGGNDDEGSDYNGKKNILLGELETPKAGEYDIVVKNRYASICGTDVERSLNVVIRYDR